MLRFLRTAALELALPVILIVIWWTVSAAHHSIYVPSLHTIVDAMTSSAFLSAMPSALAASGANFGIGLLIAVLLGIGLGLLFGSIPLLHAACYPVLEFWRAVPAVAVLPLALLFFGIGNEMKVVVIAFAAIWPILLNTIDAVRSIEPTVKATAASYRIRRSDRIFRIILPAISPQVIAGVRTSLSIGIAIVVISEMVGSTSGIGFFILDSQRTFSFPEMWGGAIVLGLVGYAVNLAFRGVEKALLGRHGPAAVGQ